MAIKCESFNACGDERVKPRTLARVRASNYSLYVYPQMEGMVRRSGKTATLRPGKYALKKGDLAHIKFGPISYFLIYVSPPKVKMPFMGPKDPLLQKLSIASALLYCAFVFSFFSIDIEAYKKKKHEEQMWSIVEVKKKKMKS